MGTINVSLSNELEAFVHAKVASGEYAHASEVLRDGLRSLMRDDADKLERLRAAIAKGVWSADEGRLIQFDDAFDRILKEGRALLKSRRSVGAASK